MRDLRTLAVLMVGTLSSPMAMALPWDIDMADAQMFKAYEAEMRPLPEGVMSQQNILTPISYRRNYLRSSPEGQALTNPLESGQVTLELGERMYGLYCTPCHGDGINLGPVALPGRYPAVPALGGDAGRLQRLTDGHAYLTIRNGGGIMPSYGWAMTNDEMWAIVSYIRTMPNSAAPAPKPEPVEAPPADDGGAE